MSVNNCTKRLMYELKEIKDSPIAGIEAEPIDENKITKWKATIQGPEGTPYEGYDINLRLDFGKKYPFVAPKVKFTSKIFHPNVDLETGDICVDILQSDNWSPALSVQKILMSISLLLITPNPDDPLDVEANKQYTENREVFNLLAAQTLKSGML